MMGVLRQPVARPRWPRKALTLAVLAAVAAPACKKKPPPTDDADRQGWGDVDQVLQVVAVSPDTVAADAPATVRVMGAGFADGASVQVGEVQAPATWQDEHTLTAEVPALSDGVYDVTVRNPDGQARTLASALTVGSGRAVLQRTCGAVTVYFALDKAGIDEAGRLALQDQLECYTTRSVRLTVEGHADARGTTDYNLALGQRRADSVRAFLVRSGIPAARVDTISYGEERPVDLGQNEEAWAKNRRVEVRPGR